MRCGTVGVICFAYCFRLWSDLVLLRVGLGVDGCVLIVVGLASFLFVALVSVWFFMVLYDCARLVILFALGVALCNLVVLLFCWVLTCVVSDGFACFATPLVSGLVV